MRSHGDDINGRIIDVGAGLNKRTWLGKGNSTYETLDLDPSSGNLDHIVSLEKTPFPDSSFDTIICTEVLEHCENPWACVKEIYRILKPSGNAFFAAPFLWVWHGRVNPFEQYNDYWRFTDQGWQVLLRDYDIMELLPIKLADEKAFIMWAAMEHMYYNLKDVRYATGYMIHARRK